MLGGMRFASTAGLAAAGAVVRRRVEREYEIGPEISGPTVAAVWATYLANIGLVAESAAKRRWPLPIPRRAAAIAGWTLAGVGAALTLTAITSFGSLARMNGRRYDRLVTGGPYRLSRHPQNVGLALQLAGVSLASRSGQALIDSAGVWAVFAPYASAEERHLRRVYGTEYEGYAARTPQFLGIPQRGEA